MQTYIIIFQGFHKSDLSVVIRAEDAYMARRIAKLQNPGWHAIISTTRDDGMTFANVA